jgi:hypothetical protein
MDITNVSPTQSLAITSDKSLSKIQKKYSALYSHCKNDLEAFMDPDTFSQPEQTKQLYDYVKDGKNITIPAIVTKVSPDIKTDKGLIYCFLTVYIGTPFMLDRPGLELDLIIEDPATKKRNTTNGNNIVATGTGTTAEKKSSSKKTITIPYLIEPNSLQSFMYDKSGSRLKEGQFIEVSKIQVSIPNKYPQQIQKLWDIMKFAEESEEHYDQIKEEKDNIVKGFVSLKTSNVNILNHSTLNHLLCESTIKLSDIIMKKPDIAEYQQAVDELNKNSKNMTDAVFNNKLFNISCGSSPFIINTNLGFSLYEDYKEECKTNITKYGRCANISQEFKSWKNFSRYDPSETAQPPELKIVYQIKWSQISDDEILDDRSIGMKFINQMVLLNGWKNSQYLSRVANPANWRLYLGPWWIKYVPFFGVFVSDLQRESQSTINIASLQKPLNMPKGDLDVYVRFFRTLAYIPDLIKGLKMFAFKPSKKAIIALYPNNQVNNSQYFDSNMHSTTQDIVLLEEFKTTDLKSFINRDSVTVYTVVCLESNILLMTEEEWTFIRSADSAMIDLLLYNNHYQANFNKSTIVQTVNDKTTYKDNQGKIIELEPIFVDISRKVFSQKISKFNYLVNIEDDEKQEKLIKLAIDKFIGETPVYTAEVEPQGSQLLSIEYGSQMMPSQSETAKPVIIEELDDDGQDILDNSQSTQTIVKTPPKKRINKRKHSANGNKKQEKTKKKKLALMATTVL